MTPTAATATAFVAAPAVPAIAVSIWIISDVNYVVSLSEAPYTFGLLVAMYFYSLIVTAIFGIPAYFLRSSIKLIWWWSTSVIGTLIGAIVFYILNVGNLSYVMNSPGSYRDVLEMAAIGGFAAFILWVIWVQGHRQPTL